MFTRQREFLTERRTKRIVALLIALLLGPGAAACGPLLPPTAPPPGEPIAACTPLPPPVVSGSVSLEESLAHRRSIRTFRDTPLTNEGLGQLLWAAQGITDDRGFRTAPSAGALYPLELYIATAQGVFHYLPEGHELMVLSDKDARRHLYEAALKQEAIRDGPAVFVITAIYARTEAKYGAERAPRYVHLEAGHATQNLLLQAIALGLGAVPIGAFHDRQVQQALGLPEDHEPLYLIPVGRP